LCGLFRIPVPYLCDAPALPAIGRLHERTLGKLPIERGLVYCPDALGDHLWTRYPDLVAAITEHCPAREHLRSVVPSVTPVCFTSVFTGTAPDRHGITQPERPVLTCDTLFDALIRAGKRVAIVAVQGSSIDLMYRDRSMDYYSEPYDAEVLDRARQVIEANVHDVVVVYQQEYDDRLHETEPFSNACLRAFLHHVASAQQLGATAREAWASCNWAMAVAPDHGAHRDEPTGRGTHGADIPEDMDVSHFYGIYAAGT
jgi:hypothetical protein